MSYDQNDINGDNFCYKKSKNRDVFLEFGLNSRDAIFEINNDHVVDNQTFILDKMLVDTKSVYRPQIKIDFSCLVFFEAESENGNEHEVEVELIFKLERTCNGVSECVQSWTYLKEFDIEGNNIDELEIEISESFAVSFIDRPCPNCCEYRMIVEGGDFEGEFDALRITKVNLSAIIQGN